MPNVTEWWLLQQQLYCHLESLQLKPLFELPL